MEYCSSVAEAFNCSKPTQIRWAHAVNSRAKLQDALSDADVHMIEADVDEGIHDETREPSDSIFNVCCSARTGRNPRRTLVMYAHLLYRVSNACAHRGCILKS